MENPEGIATHRGKIKTLVPNRRKDKRHALMTDARAQNKTYTCPMHPEVHSEKPGKCPKCGMDLIEKK